MHKATFPILLSLLLFSCEGGTDSPSHWESNAITPAEITEYSPENTPEYNDPELALGFPRGYGLSGGSTHVVTLGYDDTGEGGYIILHFDRKIINGEGADFKVFENVLSSGDINFTEAAFVELSLDGINFYRFPTLVDTEKTTDDPLYFVQGHAGINPVISDREDSSSPKPEDPDSGGDFFDLADIQNGDGDGIESIRDSGFYYIKIIDAGSAIEDYGNWFDNEYGKSSSSGFDLDAAVGIHYE